MRKPDASRFVVWLGMSDARYYIGRCLHSLDSLATVKNTGM
jgi:hypothetical protein